MSTREPVFRICKKCMRVWNVSSINPPGKQEYVCPDCEAKGKELDNEHESTDRADEILQSVI